MPSLLLFVSVGSGLGQQEPNRALILERSKSNGVPTTDLLISKGAPETGKVGVKTPGRPPYRLVLLSLRRNGALSGFREILRNGVQEIASASDSDVADIAEAVAINININTVLTQHELELDQLATSKKRFFGKDVLPWVTTAALSMITATTACVPLSLIVTAAGLMGLPSGRDLVTKGKEILFKSEQLTGSPIAFLFKHITTNRSSLIDRYRVKR
jgi:hypothetical protein